MSEVVRATSAGSNGAGGNDGRKGNDGMNPNAKEFVPTPKAPLETYQREFVSSVDRNFDQQFGMGRSRSYSIGVYDPNTDTRSNRIHVHTIDGIVQPGSSVKPNASGRYGGEGLSYTSNVIK